jgi:ABC-type multidrug transport system ATPase subunit
MSRCCRRGCASTRHRLRRRRASALSPRSGDGPAGQNRQITGKRRMRELSKGMKTQVHLALTMAIDAKLLVLDEPTLGLDILARAPSTTRWSMTTWTRRGPY